MDQAEMIHVWAANFSNEAEQERIFGEPEHYGDDEQPINSFAESQGEWFYDHDFLYLAEKQAFFSDTSINELCRADIQEKWNLLARDELTTVVVADGNDFQTPVSCAIGHSEFIYLGNFRLTPS